MEAIFRRWRIGAASLALPWIMGWAAAMVPPAALAQQGYGTIRCGSESGGYARCRTPWRGAELWLVESKANCIRGQSWGFDRGDIWVDRGCRAQFQRAGGPHDKPGSGGFGGGNGWHGGNSGGFGGGNSGGFGGGNGWHGGNSGGFGSFGGGNGSHGGSGYQGGGQFGRPSAKARTVQCGSVNKAYRFCPAGIGAHQQVVLEVNQSDKRCKWARDWGVQDGGIWVSNGCRGVFSIR